jgi:hypothetical protein
VGHKPSNFFQMDRPESGGANRKGERDAPELLDRAKEEFAQTEARQSRKSKAADEPPRLAEPPSRAARSTAKGRTGKRRKK